MKIDAPISVDESKFDEMIGKHELVVVDFWANWCPPCLAMSPIIHRLAKKYAGRIVFLKVDVDKYRSLADRYGIRSIPAFLIFKKGKLVDIIIGYTPMPIMEKKIIRYLAKPVKQ